MRLLVLSVMLLANGIAVAERPGYDVDRCLEKSGAPMHPIDCQILRKKRDEERASQERADRRLEESRAYAARQAEEAARARAEIERENQAKAARWRDEHKAAEEASRREMDAYARKERAAQKIAAERARAAQKVVDDRERVRRDECGADYRSPRIGMSLSRAQQCVGNFRLTAQLSRADGVISTYVGSGMYLNVMNGVVVSWGR